MSYVNYPINYEKMLFIWNNNRLIKYIYLIQENCSLCKMKNISVIDFSRRESGNREFVISHHLGALGGIICSFCRKYICDICYAKNHKEHISKKCIHCKKIYEETSDVIFLREFLWSNVKHRFQTTKNNMREIIVKLQIKGTNIIRSDVI